jgi:phospholipase/carboxylesterase
MKSVAIFFCVLMSIAGTLAYGQSTEGLESGLSLKYRLSATASKNHKPALVILLHGYGSNEEDLLGLSQFFPPDFIILSARAPYKADVGGYQWFERELVNGKYSGKPEHIRHSKNLILKFVDDAIKKYHGDAGRVYLVGFSQGAMMCYETGISAPEKIKGIGVLSGKMSAGLMSSIHADKKLKSLRMFIAHGTSDTQLPYADGKAAYDRLLEIGLMPELHTYPGMDHTISREVMTDLIAWIKK